MKNSDRILEFVSQNQETTEYKVAKYMSENHYCARDTTHNLIYNKLIVEGKIIDKKIGNSFHRLCINDKSEFNNLLCQIVDFKKQINDLADVHLGPLLASLKKSKHNQFVDEHFQTLIQMVQLAVYLGMTSRLTSIEKNIKLSDDREFLYHELLSALTASEKLNKIMLPGLLIRINRMSEVLRKSKVVKEQKGLYDSIDATIKGISNSNSKNN